MVFPDLGFQCSYWRRKDEPLGCEELLLSVVSGKILRVPEGRVGVEISWCGSLLELPNQACKLGVLKVLWKV